MSSLLCHTHNYSEAKIQWKSQLPNPRPTYLFSDIWDVCIWESSALDRVSFHFLSKASSCQFLFKAGSHLGTFGDVPFPAYDVYVCFLKMYLKIICNIALFCHEIWSWSANLGSQELNIWTQCHVQQCWYLMIYTSMLATLTSSIAWCNCLCTQHGGFSQGMDGTDGGPFDLGCLHWTSYTFGNTQMIVPSLLTLRATSSLCWNLKISLRMPTTLTIRHEDQVVFSTYASS